MPRFKQALSGLSRLSDRSGGVGNFPRLMFYNQGAQGNTTTSLNPAITESGDLILAFAISASSSVPTLPPEYTDLGTVGTQNGIIRAFYKISDGTETATRVSVNAVYVAAFVFRNHGGVAKTLKTSVASSTTFPSIGTMLDVNGGSRIAVGTNSNFDTARQTEGAVLNTKVGISANPLQDGQDFGGVVFNTKSTPAQQNFFAVEVLAA